MISPLIIVIKKFTSNIYPFLLLKSNTIKSKPSKQLICGNCFEGYNKLMKNKVISLII